MAARARPGACSVAKNPSPVTLQLHALGHVTPSLGASSLCSQVSWADSGAGGHLLCVLWTY